MQLTNIARDVFEDAQMGRRYIPRSWCDVSAENIVENSVTTQQKVIDATKRLLALSECYYNSGWQGLRYLPKNSRNAIAIAASVYREIGMKLAARHNYAYWKGRTRVGLPKKVLIASSVMVRGGYPEFAEKRAPSIDVLHASIMDLQPASIIND